MVSPEGPGGGRASRFSEYLSLRPASLRDRLALYSALARAAVLRSLKVAHYVGPGPLLRRDIVVDSLGLRFQVRKGSDDLEYTLPDHKPAVAAWFDPQRGERVVDVGAHLGFHSMVAARRGAIVLALEPNPSVYSGLVRNVTLNGFSSVQPVPAAAASRRGVRELRFPSRLQGFASLRPDWVQDGALPPGESLSNLRVDTIPLDELLLPGEWPVVDWLLIDVEGAEAEVLEGGRSTLRRTRHAIIEVSDGPSAVAVGRIVDDSGLFLLDRRPQSSQTEYRLYGRR